MVARDQIRDHELAGLRSGTPGEPHQLERARLVAGGLGGLPYIGQVRKSTSLIGGTGGILLYRPCRRAAVLRPVIDLGTGLGPRLLYGHLAVVGAAPLLPAAEGRGREDALQLRLVLGPERQDPEERQVGGRVVASVVTINIAG